MTVTIQNGSSPCELDCGDARRSFFQHAANLYGTALSDHELDELAELDDLTAVDRAFPWLSDPERHELLWAIGQPG
jgi:zona occludens toxin (predicted ATPase)